MKIILSVSLIGGTEDENAKTIKILQNNYPDLKLIFCRNGFFRTTSERNDFFAEVTLNSPDIIVLGLGTPYQENCAIDIKYKYKLNSIVFTCGGFISQTSRGLSYYSEFIDKYNLRWFRRALDNPYVIKRLFINYPKFYIKLIFNYLFNIIYIK